VESLPRELERIIAGCLRKNPERRFQAMTDLKVALEELKEESDSGNLGTVLAPKRQPSCGERGAAASSALTYGDLGVRVMASWCSGTPVNTTGWKVGGRSYT
jgi:hypothetical protein